MAKVSSLFVSLTFCVYSFEEKLRAQTSPCDLTVKQTALLLVYNQVTMTAACCSPDFPAFYHAYHSLRFDSVMRSSQLAGDWEIKLRDMIDREPTLRTFPGRKRTSANLKQFLFALRQHINIKRRGRNRRYVILFKLLTELFDWP